MADSVSQGHKKIGNDRRVDLEFLNFYREHVLTIDSDVSPVPAFTYSMPFLDLPLELLPLIVKHLLRPHHLSQACLVSKDFYSYTVPQLYERTTIFAWHREGKKKATQLLWTLANCPKLARYVRRLELRDFPKAISRDSANELTQLCVLALSNCVNLTSCTWTRDGSLKDDILEALSQCPSLDTLEINGRHAHNYDPLLLNKFESLRKISVIMPSAEVVHVLPGFFQQNYETLQELTIICKFTSVVTDTWLQSMAPSLSRLKKLHLAGCPKITHHGIIDLLHANTAGIVDLALEGVSPSFDMKDLAVCSSHSLSRLSSVTLTIPVVGITRFWLSDVEMLLFDALSLRQLHLYASGDRLANPLSLDAEFVRRFVERHKESLTRFAVLRLPINTIALKFVVRNAIKLEQLFVSMWRKDLSKLGPIIAQSSTLCTLHVTYAYSTDADRASIVSSDSDSLSSSNGEEEEEDLFLAHLQSSNRFASGTQNPLPSMAELEMLASQFGGSVTQFGVQTRVWQIERIPAVNETDSEVRPSGTARLVPYESLEVPDVFLVVRT